MKSKSSLIALVALAAMVGWASVETYKLWLATQQVAASQQLEMKVSARLDSVRARQIQLANVDASARGAGAGQK